MSELAHKDHAGLERAIGHEFASHDYLVRALTHPSFFGYDGDPRPAHYERLEFLGDRVLGLVIAELLFKRYPDSEEGGLATRYNMLVRKETCAAVAERIALGDYLRLGSGEVQAGGRSKQAILGDACEALIAAIYFDGGIEAAHRFIESHWDDLLDEVDEPQKDPKTALQEWTQGRGQPAPRYRMVNRSGPDHEPTFTIAVEVDGSERAQGRGLSKRIAEQEAARTFLVREGLMEP